MIRYSLTCPQSHEFDSWFQSAAAFDVLAKAGHLSCPNCGAGEVTKALMAPSVSTPAKSSAGAVPDLARKTETTAALAAMRQEIEANSEYVGMNFVAEARAIHNGTSPERAIYGKARLDEARKLIEDGVPVAPLPFLPKRETN